MKIFYDITDWQATRRTFDNQNSIGFVATMGNLHAGHETLLLKSKEENDLSVASIFVNPSQFNNPDDFKNYPRTLAEDLLLLEKAGVDYCLLPSQEEIYADGFRYTVQESKLCQLMEGKHRPGHFTGVLTIVMKLLNLVNPNRTYFGEKDYQQYLLIRDMINAFFMNITIKVCPTVREKNGLAYSSRNNRLSASQRLEAEKFAEIFQQDKNCESLMEEFTNQGIMIEYLEEYEGRRFVAAIFGDIRLIDNYSLNPKD